MTVSAILAEKGRDVVTLGPEATLIEAARLLDEKKIGAVVITDGGSRLLGILSERDIVRAVARDGAAALGAPVRSAMTARVVTCREHESVHEVMTRMTRGRFRHLPVVESERMVGVVSIGDVVKRRIEDVEREAEHMRRYIATA